MNMNVVNCALLIVILVLVVMCHVKNRNVENALVTVTEQA